MASLRTPLATPASTLTNALRARVVICHPAYEGGGAALFDLAASDGDGNGDEPGVDHDLVLSACMVVTGRTDAWLSPHRIPECFTPPAPDATPTLLLVGTYYLHLPSPSVEEQRPISLSPALPPGIWHYPVFPNFRSWPFPHGKLPPIWAAVPETVMPADQPSGPVPDQVRARDRSCRLTGHIGATEHAHCIPSIEKDWFAANAMQQYRTSDSKGGRDVVDAESNILLLREDIHSLWDKMSFMLVPKRPKGAATAVTPPEYVVHVSDAAELHMLYHNRRLQTLRGIPVEYIFARFAWHIFPTLLGFLQAGHRRILAVHQEGRVLSREYSASECEELCKGQGRGRSASPTKRKRGADGAQPPTASPADALDRRSLDSGVSGLEKSPSAAEAGWEDDTHEDGDDFLRGYEDEDEDEGKEDDLFGDLRRRRQELMEKEVAAEDEEQLRKSERDLGFDTNDDEESRGRKRIRT